MAHPIALEVSQTLIGAILKDYPGTPSQRPERLSEEQVGRISELLARAGKLEWSRIPRIYAVLYMINKVDVVQSFIDRGVSDLWFPFTPRTLPNDLLSVSDRYDFREVQDLVLTKGLDLEKEDGKHRHFAKVEDIPLRKLGELGKGGFGRVDLVYSTITHNEYARKLIPRGKTFEMNAQKLKDFERELGSLKKLHHKHVVQMVGSYTDPKFVCILMSPVADVNLKVFLTSGALTRNQMSLLRTFYGCLATALQYLHDNKVRHKDIKPQNILVRGDQVFLTDFGISHDWSDSGQNTTTGYAIKTEKYCAPEVAHNHARNNSSDMWSLGCVFLEIWTVLKGETLQRLDTYMEDSVSGTVFYYLNCGAITMWCKGLVANTETVDEDPALEWIQGIMHVDSDLRWSAQKLVVCIADADDDPKYHVSFIGQCCSFIHDDTASDLSSKRSSKAFDETGASSVKIYGPSQEPTQQDKYLAYSHDQLPDIKSRGEIRSAQNGWGEPYTTDLQPYQDSRANGQTKFHQPLPSFKAQQMPQPPSSAPLKPQQTSSQKEASSVRYSSDTTSSLSTQHNASEIPDMRLSFLTSTDQAKFQQLFKSAAGTSQALDGDKFKDLLIRSGLPSSVLSQIWLLSNVTKSGTMLFPEFALAMYLCNLKLTGKDLPTVLPDKVSDEVWKMVDVISFFGVPDNEATTPVTRTKLASKEALFQREMEASADKTDDTIQQTFRPWDATSIRPMKIPKPSSLAGNSVDETIPRKPIRSTSSLETDVGRPQQETLIPQAVNTQAMYNVKSDLKTSGEHIDYTRRPQPRTTVQMAKSPVERGSTPLNYEKHTLDPGESSHHLDQASKDKYDPQPSKQQHDLQAFGGVQESLPNGLAISPVQSRSSTLETVTTVDWKKCSSLEDHADWVRSVAFSPDSKLLASGSSDNTVKLWNTTTGQIARTLPGYPDWISAVAFSPNGKQLASGSRDKKIRLSNVTTGQDRLILSGHSEWILSVAFSPDGKLLASGSRDKTVRIWNAATGREIFILSGHSRGVWSVAFSPHGELLVSGSDDNSILIWDTTTGQNHSILSGHSNTVYSVAFSPDGRSLASGSYDKTVRLWDATTRETRLVLSGHLESVYSIAFSPDGKLLASGSRDQTVRIWDVATGQALRTLSGHLHWVMSVAFSPDGKLLASGSRDKTVRLWGLVLPKEKPGSRRYGNQYSGVQYSAIQNSDTNNFRTKNPVITNFASENSGGKKSGIDTSDVGKPGIRKTVQNLFKQYMVSR